MQLCISPGIRPSCIKGPRSKEGTNGLLDRGRLRIRRVNHTAPEEPHLSKFEASNGSLHVLWCYISTALIQAQPFLIFPCLRLNLG